MTYAKKAEQFKKLFVEMIEEDVQQSLALITGVFVGFTLAVVGADGIDTDKEIKIDSGGNRDITIHARENPNVG